MRGVSSRCVGTTCHTVRVGPIEGRGRLRRPRTATGYHAPGGPSYEPRAFEVNAAPFSQTLGHVTLSAGNRDGPRITPGQSELRRIHRAGLFLSRPARTARRECTHSGR